MNLKEESVLRRRVIAVSVLAKVDPALILFSEGIEVSPADEHDTLETSGNADVQLETSEST